MPETVNNQRDTQIKSWFHIFFSQFYHSRATNQQEWKGMNKGGKRQKTLIVGVMKKKTLTMWLNLYQCEGSTEVTSPFLLFNKKITDK